MNIKTGRYASVGLVTASSGSRFGVRDNVSLPDADAGTELESCFRADPSRVESRKAEPKKISLKAAISVITVAVLLGIVAVSNSIGEYNRTAEKLEDLYRSMNQTRQDNIVLSGQVASARELTRIGYIAVTELGMVASDETNTVVMYMPEVEKYAAAPGDGPAETKAESTRMPTQSGVRAER